MIDDHDQIPSIYGLLCMRTVSKIIPGSALMLIKSVAPGHANKIVGR